MVSRCVADDTISAVKSSGPLPFSVSTASWISSALPTAHPSGCPISVSLTPDLAALALAELDHRLSQRASVVDGAHERAFPTLTSSKIAEAPEAIFFDMMLAAISEISLTVAVTSRRAYRRASAGTSVGV